MGSGDLEKPFGSVYLKSSSVKLELEKEFLDVQYCREMQISWADIQKLKSCMSSIRFSANMNCKLYSLRGYPGNTDTASINRRSVGVR